MRSPLKAIRKGGVLCQCDMPLRRREVANASKHLSKMTTRSSGGKILKDQAWTENAVCLIGQARRACDLPLLRRQRTYSESIGISPSKDDLVSMAKSVSLRRLVAIFRVSMKSMSVADVAGKKYSEKSYSEKKDHFAYH